MSKSGVNSCDESVSKTNANVFVSGGVLFQYDISVNDDVVSDQTDKSDLNVSTPSTSALKSCDESCKCTAVPKPLIINKFVLTVALLDTLQEIVWTGCLFLIHQKEERMNFRDDL